MKALCRSMMVGGTILVLALAGELPAWCGSLDGDQFVVEPWLIKTSVPASKKVPLYFKVENPSNAPVVIKDLYLRWGVTAIDGKPFTASGVINLNEHGAPPFTEYRQWPHSVFINPIASITVPPVQLKLPPGRYGYGIELFDPNDSNRVLLTSGSLVFEVGHFQGE